MLSLLRYAAGPRERERDSVPYTIWRQRRAAAEAEACTCLLLDPNNRTVTTVDLPRKLYEEDETHYTEAAHDCIRL